MSPRKNLQQICMISCLKSNFCLQIGHDRLEPNQLSIHSRWQRCLQEVVLISSSCWQSMRHIEQHSISPVFWRFISQLLSDSATKKQLFSPYLVAGIKNSTYSICFFLSLSSLSGLFLLPQYLYCVKSSLQLWSILSSRSNVYLLRRQLMKMEKMVRRRDAVEMMMKLPQYVFWMQVQYFICIVTVWFVRTEIEVAYLWIGLLSSDYGLRQIVRQCIGSSFDKALRPTTILRQLLSYLSLILMQCVENEAQPFFPRSSLAVSNKDCTALSEPSFFQVQMQKIEGILEGLCSMQMLKDSRQQFAYVGQKQKQLKLVDSEAWRGCYLRV